MMKPGLPCPCCTDGCRGVKTCHHCGQRVCQLCHLEHSDDIPSHD